MVHQLPAAAAPPSSAKLLPLKLPLPGATRPSAPAAVRDVSLVARDSLVMRSGSPTPVIAELDRRRRFAHMATSRCLGVKTDLRLVKGGAKPRTCMQDGRRRGAHRKRRRARP